MQGHSLGRNLFGNLLQVMELYISKIPERPDTYDNTKYRERYAPSATCLDSWAEHAVLKSEPLVQGLRMVL